VVMGRYLLVGPDWVDLHLGHLIQIVGMRGLVADVEVQQERLGHFISENDEVFTYQYYR